MVLPFIALTFFGTDQKNIHNSFGKGYVLRFEFPFADYRCSSAKFTPIGILEGTALVRPGLLRVCTASCSSPVNTTVQNIAALVSSVSDFPEDKVLEYIGADSTLWKGTPTKVAEHFAYTFSLSKNILLKREELLLQLTSVVNAYHGFLYALEQRTFAVHKETGMQIAKSAPLLFHESFYHFFAKRVVNDSAVQLGNPKGLLLGVVRAQKYIELKQKFFVPKPEIAELALLNS